MELISARQVCKILGISRGKLWQFSKPGADGSKPMLERYTVKGLKSYRYDLGQVAELIKAKDQQMPV